MDEKGGVIVRISFHSLLYTRAHEEHCGAQAVKTTSIESDS